MALTQEDNVRLTRVGPGTPMGELLRRYWQPVCTAVDLTTEKPRRRVRVFGEDLVVFRLPDGTLTALRERCSHRGASLFYGFVEDGGVRCAYHGWKYDGSGQCVDQPFESNPKFKNHICQPSYPVRQLAGLLFVYMGPAPVPELPRWDVTVRTDGTRQLTVHDVLQANWLVAMENAVDTVHTHFLHGHVMRSKGLNAGQYYLRPLEAYEFHAFELGIMKQRTYGGDDAETEVGHPLLFPNMLRNPAGPFESMHWRVPIDDEHTQIFVLDFRPDPTRAESGWADPLEDVPVRHLPSGRGDDGEYDMNTFPSQDKMAYETPGAIFDRTQEHLGSSDRGIVLYRRMLREQLEIVAKGHDPMNVVRDPDRNDCIRIVSSKGQSSDKWAEGFGYYQPGATA